MELVGKMVDEGLQFNSIVLCVKTEIKLATSNYC